ncbi:OLC1v1001931C1 [Oldenlandia corymbosa var. corymbosa]|uniref:Pectinesterase n=1 Tax=Oldenlandia corymbosa var. corymbosa TaxID=529605 RepID=A0AAV1D6F9_OLDCO|nr:OLC1v1001931C1 [Oldenlandia corymbosa var. corymbosa]
MRAIMSIATLILCLCLHSFPSYIHAASSSPSSYCDMTPHPNFCRSQEPQNKPTNVQGYGRYSIQKALSTSTSLLNSINGYLNSGRSSSSKTLILALRDCQTLLSSNVEMLSNVAQTVQNSNTLQTSQYEDFETLLSTTITYKQTCLDGLETAGSSVANEILPSLNNGTMLCSMSLAFFKKGWVPPKRSRSLAELFRPFSSIHHRRKLLQLTGVNVNKNVTVNPDGSGNFTTINAAIAAAPNITKSSQGYYRIQVAAGVYEEYINIPSYQKYLMIVGDGINKTIITGNHSVDDGWTTFDSATFAVNAQGFIGVNFTIRNTAGAAKHQAVALRNDADLSVFYLCSFEGYQDTLYTHSKRQFYRECDVYGTVDYIFGNAAVVLQHCNIYSRLPLPGQFNTVTAQGKVDINQNAGTSIHDCNIKAADDLASSNGTTQTYLGRPWKTYSTTIVMESFLDSLINPAGWAPWSGNQSLDTLYYAEYNNTGPGSNTSSRVTWPGYHIITNGSDVLNVTVSNFISGDNWLPSTEVPYVGGLLYYP